MNRASLIALGTATLVALLLGPNQATALAIADTPLFLVGNVQPQVMLAISKDQQLYKKAYNDYSDLDNDGQLETTYKHSIDYYGYFDPKKCYVYDSTDKRFEPHSVSSTKYCTAGANQWSGNFLNWASMARMDAVRKLLYGGMRSKNRTDGDGSGITDGDTAESTVLERVFLPNDAHSWAKYYDGSDLSTLTPYNTPPVTNSTSATPITITNDGTNTVIYEFTVASADPFATNDYVLVSVSADPSTYLRGQITAKNNAQKKLTVQVAKANYAGSGTHSSWTVENLSTRGITLCNTTLGRAAPQNKSQTNTNLPRLRVAKGNFSLWNANERWQCRWDEEKGANNSNDFGASGIPAASQNPKLATHGNGTGLGDYFVRVQACVPSLIGEEDCKQYDTANANNYKPVGLLQVYGDSDQIRFGLMTGSYTKNISGGVIRKNVGPFTDEVNVATNGTFTSTSGIVATLDRLRIYGYDYDDGTYLDASGDQCNFGLTSIVEGTCTSWGNPMSEVFFESLRYFTTTAATAASKPLYSYTDTGSRDAALGLPQPTWTAPVTQTNYCAPINTLVFNASVSTNDFDLAGTAMGDIGSASTAAALADVVGTGEGIAGKSYFIGANGTDNNELCDAKTVGNLGSIWGICPEGPTQLGSYLMPGLAHHAHTSRIRTDLTVPDTDKKSLKVRTYGVQLATNVPRIPITLFDETTPRVILQPAFRLDKSSSNSNPKSDGGGTLVEMQILGAVASPTTASGTIYVNWEDSEQGGDYDQDLWGLIRYCLTTVAGGCGQGSSANTVTVTTDAVAQSTPYKGGFGYTISGTTKDGAHFHSGINDFDFTDKLIGVLNCVDCKVADAATTQSYTLSGAVAANTLLDPLFYAAKWGGFNDLNGDGKPSSAAEWDVLKFDGKFMTPGSDGVPDTYFLVSNPLGLEAALNAAFLDILLSSSASAVATNSSTLNTGSRVYQGRFSNSFWSGQLLSYRLDSQGSVVSAATPPPGWDAAETPYPEWDAGQIIKGQASASTDSRLILTRGTSGAGTDFAYTNLSSAQQGALDSDAKASQDYCGLERVSYLRGHSVNEGIGTFTCATSPSKTIGRFRTREVSILGDIINSNPVFVGAPAGGHADADHFGYTAFALKFKDRKPVVYVGANDGLLHGFDVSVTAGTNLPTADAGKEVLGYIPSPVYGNLSQLTDKDYKSKHKYFVDGSPMVADACLSGCTAGTAVWKTVLVGSLGAGGKGFYALNVTNPKDAAKDSADTPEFKVTRAADLVLWEFTNADDVDLGLTFNGAPVNLNTGQARQVAKFENGRWGVIVGNGYNSSGGKAVLYVLFLTGPTGAGPAWQAGGVDYVKIEANAGPDNGLSTPVPFDADGDGLADTAYAGDLKGNVWKFDLSAATTGSWGKSLLFAAGAAQPFTAAPEISLHPDGGTMVLIGSGKYLETTDNDTGTPVQTLYGIRDTGSTVAIGELNPMVVATSTIGSKTFRTTASGCGGESQPDCPASSKGWFVNLPTAGERATGSPKLVAGTAFFNTLIPSTALCDFGGTGWLMALDYLTGGPRSFQVFDTDGSGTIDVSDAIVVAVEVGAAVGGTTLIQAGTSGGTGVGVSSLTSGKMVSTLIKFGGGAPRRMNWREIIQ